VVDVIRAVATVVTLMVCHCKSLKPLLLKLKLHTEGRLSISVNLCKAVSAIKWWIFLQPSSVVFHMSSLLHPV